MTSVMGNSTQLRKSLRVSVQTFSHAHSPIEKQRLLHVREPVTVGGATGMVTSRSFRRRLIACHNGRNSGRPTRARQAASEEGGDRRES